MLQLPMGIPREWYESEQAQAYMSRNPNSFLIRMLGNRAPQPPTTAGSNNAGDTAPSFTPPSQGGAPNRPFRVNNGTPGMFARRSQPTQSPYASGSNNSIPSFYDGGMMSEHGKPIRPGMGMQPEAPGGVPIGADAPPPLEVSQIDAEAGKMLQSNPQLVAQVQELVTYAIQSGQLTSEEMNMAVQLAKTALANPASYPQVRQFAIQNGLGSEADIPQELDKGMLFALIAVGKAMQSGAPTGQGPQPASAPAPAQQAGIIPEYKEGGMTGDKAHIAKVHADEYIVPKKALLYHGKKTFDRLVEQANEVPDGQ